jgi:hypothetical protein
MQYAAVTKSRAMPLAQEKFRKLVDTNYSNARENNTLLQYNNLKTTRAIDAN